MRSTDLFQSIDYVYYPHKNSRKEPLSGNYDECKQHYPVTGRHGILKRRNAGYRRHCLVGEAVIEQVEVSKDGGQTWGEARLEHQSGTAYTGRSGHSNGRKLRRGEYTVMARACDAQGRQQPRQAFWNQKGYGTMQ
ncbi:hypothetical protein ACFOLK_16200 [Marinococcus halophilus]|uniref:hypothetical protein n=1 Tax=Marinococcus halophilus TaxID=1371 RepID=UPI0036088CEC